MDNDNSDQALAIEATVWIVVTAIHQAQLSQERPDNTRLFQNAEFLDLCRDGCDPWVLFNVLLLASIMPTYYPPISASALRKLARDLRDVLGRMHRITPSLLLPFATDFENGRYGLPELEPTGGALHVYPDLEKELCLKAKAYEKLADLCAKKLVPTRAQIKKLAYLWPVLYVEEKTGSPHYSKVSRLLGFVEIDKNDNQLIKGAAAAKSTFPLAVNWMKASLGFLGQASTWL